MPGSGLPVILSLRAPTHSVGCSAVKRQCAESEIRYISGLGSGEFRIRKHTSNTLNLVWFGFEVPKHGCHRNDGNFKSTTRPSPR